MLKKKCPAPLSDPAIIDQHQVPQCGWGGIGDGLDRILHQWIPQLCDYFRHLLDPRLHVRLQSNKNDDKAGDETNFASVGDQNILDQYGQISSADLICQIVDVSHLH